MKANTLSYFELNPNEIPLSIFLLAFYSLIYALRTPNLRERAIKLVEVVFNELADSEIERLEKHQTKIKR